MHDPSSIAVALIVFRENDLNAKKFTLPMPPAESNMQARQKREEGQFFKKYLLIDTF